MKTSDIMVFNKTKSNFEILKVRSKKVPFVMQWLYHVHDNTSAFVEFGQKSTLIYQNKVMYFPHGTNPTIYTLQKVLRRSQFSIETNALNVF